MPAPAEEKNLATWGTDVPDDLNLDLKKLAEALKKVSLGTTDSLFCYIIGRNEFWWT